MKAHVLSFLRLNPSIAKLNFKINGLGIWPDGYRKDIADAIDKGDIQLATLTSMRSGVAAEYDSAYNQIGLNSGFSMKSTSDLAMLIHECTHAYADKLKLGTIARNTSEAAGYIAEQTFHQLEAGVGYSVSQPIRAEAHRIATNVVIPGKYEVPALDVAAIEGKVAADAHYSTKPASYGSDGLATGIGFSILRGAPQRGVTKH